jgi:hypothetical protein
VVFYVLKFKVSNISGDAKRLMLYESYAKLLYNISGDSRYLRVYDVSGDTKHSYDTYISRDKRLFNGEDSKFLYSRYFRIIMITFLQCCM